ncbi:MAG TPA: hypothetical protein VH135_06955, partial [Steroidobacteraceae bacterium]|nr:hypothetical protein [Steroidobacteraceae bacterium]
MARAMLPAFAIIAACQPATSALAAAEPPASPAPGLSTRVAFSDYGPLSASSEIMRRLLSPL